MMDTVTYFRFTERVILGTGGIPVYHEDSRYQVPKHPEKIRSYDVVMSQFIDSVGVECPICNVGFRVKSKDYKNEEYMAICPCCDHEFRINHNGKAHKEQKGNGHGSK